MSTHGDDTEINTVEALYDYNYNDDDGNPVKISAGEKYELLHKANNDWWHVRRLTDEEDFYVPAEYVREIQLEESVIQDFDDIIAEHSSSPNPSHDTEPPKDDRDVLKDAEPVTSQHKRLSDNVEVVENNGSLKTIIHVNVEENSEYANVSRQTVHLHSSSDRLASPAFTSSEYANLNDYRQAAGINQTDNGRAKSQYDNVPDTQQRMSNKPPLPEMCQLIKTVLDRWEVYKDPLTGRIFYCDLHTGERTWKPPRPERTSDKSAEIWQSFQDEKGRVYYCKEGTPETVWDLPDLSNESTPTTSPHSSSLSLSGENGETIDELRDHAKVKRNWKAKSMFVELKKDHPAPRPPTVKASTLPANFNAISNSASEEGKSDSPSDTTPPDVNLLKKEQVKGSLNRKILFENGKKVKKGWVQCYALLGGSNIVFYKDQKDAKHRPGSPHGKPEFMVPLSDARVEFQPKDVGGRKNVILLTRISTNTQYLLHTDDNIMIHKWYVHSKLLIDDISQPTVETSPRGTSSSTFYTDVSRSLSMDETTQRAPAFDGGAIAAERAPLATERRWKIQNIGEKIRSLLIRRPTLESLEERGIIKGLQFGSNLKTICEREHSNVPKFVRNCILAIEKKGHGPPSKILGGPLPADSPQTPQVSPGLVVTSLNHDGLYRLSGNLAEVQKLRFTVDQDHDYDLDDDLWDINVLTGALKLFFRELKEPLFPFNCFDRFVAAVKKPQASERLKGFKEIFSGLPKCNYETMKLVFKHLNKVIDLSSENRMEVHNMAIVFGPTLIWPNEIAPNIMENTVYQSQIIQFVLLEYKTLFR